MIAIFSKHEVHRRNLFDMFPFAISFLCLIPVQPPPRSLAEKSPVLTKLSFTIDKWQISNSHISQTGFYYYQLRAPNWFSKVKFTSSGLRRRKLRKLFDIKSDLLGHRWKFSIMMKSRLSKVCSRRADTYGWLGGRVVAPTPEIHGSNSAVQFPSLLYVWSVLIKRLQLTLQIMIR